MAQKSVPGQDFLLCTPFLFKQKVCISALKVNERGVLEALCLFLFPIAALNTSCHSSLTGLTGMGGLT